MSRSNYNKPFYVDVGTSVVAIRCASNHDVIVEYDYGLHPYTLNLAKDLCDRMNREVEIGRPRRNCDVGTVEERAKRYHEFCRGRMCETCLASTAEKDDSLDGSCIIQWEDMPYEEGGEK